MYKMNDKAAAIREIQMFLERLNLLNSYIAPSGIYDEKTKAAVIKFQNLSNIKSTGVVDYITYSKLFESYTKVSKVQKIDNNIGQNVVFPLRHGDYGEHIYAFNDILSKILNEYGIFHSLRRSMYFSEETEEAVRVLRKMFLMEEGEADQLFYDRVLNELKIIRNKGNLFKKI